jgi:type VII secretion protein EccE
VGVNARTARILTTEVAAAGVLVAAASGPIACLAAALTGAVVTAAVWTRLHGRPLTGWLGVALRHRRARPPDALTGPLRTVPLPAPPSRLPHEGGQPRHTAIDDEHGLTALLELGDPDALIAPDVRTLPHPAQLGTTAHLQLVLAIDPAHGGTTEIPARVRALLAVRVPHRPGRDAARDLTGALRTIRAALGDLPHRPLTGPEIHRTITDLAGTDGPPHQTWRHVRTPGRVQTVFRVSGRRPPVEDLARLDAARITLAITATDTLIRIAAAGEMTLGDLRRLDGEHLSALTATLPLARDPHVDARTDRRPVTLPRDGLFLGRDREGEPVVIRPFRAGAPTTIALVGGLRGAQLLTLRALAIGAVVVVRTDRPHAWAPLLRTADPTGTATRLTSTGPRGMASRPADELIDSPGRVLEMLDRATGPTPSRHATLLVLEELTPETAAIAARADLLLLQQQRAGNAAVAERHLGLGRAAGWLTRIGPDLFAVVADRALRWAAPSPTETESHLLDGTPA